MKRSADGFNTEPLEIEKGKEAYRGKKLKLLEAVRDEQEKTLAVLQNIAASLPPRQDSRRCTPYHRLLSLINCSKLLRWRHKKINWLKSVYQSSS